MDNYRTKQICNSSDSSSAVAGFVGALNHHRLAPDPLSPADSWRISQIGTSTRPFDSEDLTMKLWMLSAERAGIKD